MAVPFAPGDICCRFTESGVSAYIRHLTSVGVVLEDIAIPFLPGGGTTAQDRGICFDGDRNLYIAGAFDDGTENVGKILAAGSEIQPFFSYTRNEAGPDWEIKDIHWRDNELYMAVFGAQNVFTSGFIDPDYIILNSSGVIDREFFCHDHVTVLVDPSVAGRAHRFTISDYIYEAYGYTIGPTGDDRSRWARIDRNTGELTVIIDIKSSANRGDFGHTYKLPNGNFTLAHNSSFDPSPYSNPPHFSTMDEIDSAGNRLGQILRREGSGLTYLSNGHMTYPGNTLNWKWTGAVNNTNKTWADDDGRYIYLAGIEAVGVNQYEIIWKYDPATKKLVDQIDFQVGEVNLRAIAVAPTPGFPGIARVPKLGTTQDLFVRTSP